MITFAKAHAYGNDFVYVRSSDVEGAVLAALARELCDRHTGVGADGLIVYESHFAAASMQLFNADGSRAEVSGNGVRALGALLLKDDDRPDAELAVRTNAGVRRLARVGRDGIRQTFRAFMGQPAEVRTLPPVEVAGETLRPTVLTMGNPHCVLVGPLPDRARFERLGAALERHDLFPNSTNVEFVEVSAPDHLRVLIWERGVGPTSSSGTGSCAALVAAASIGSAAREAEVSAPGGTQHVEWQTDGVYLTGWAEVLFVGEWFRSLP